MSSPGIPVERKSDDFATMASSLRARDMQGVSPRPFDRALEVKSQAHNVSTKSGSMTSSEGHGAVAQLHLRGPVS